MIISKIKIHPLFYFVLFISLISGNFKNILIFTSLIIVHETGHIITGIICGWKIDKITLLPFGGITNFDTKINRSLIEEFFIAISGPLFQIIFYILFKDHLIKEYHLALLYFNLIPIYPLDGYKILKTILMLIIPFKKNNYLTLIISLIISIYIISKYHNLAFILIISCLIYKTITEYKKIPLIFNRFLIERYLYNIPFKKTKTIRKIDNMLYYTNHRFHIKNKYLTEKEYLHKMFDNQ